MDDGGHDLQRERRRCFFLGWHSCTEAESKGLQWSLSFFFFLCRRTISLLLIEWLSSRVPLFRRSHSSSAHIALQNSPPLSLTLSRRQLSFPSCKLRAFIHSNRHVCRWASSPSRGFLRRQQGRRELGSRDVACVSGSRRSLDLLLFPREQVEEGLTVR